MWGSLSCCPVVGGAATAVQERDERDGQTCLHVVAAGLPKLKIEECAARQQAHIDSGKQVWGAGFRGVGRVPHGWWCGGVVPRCHAAAPPNRLLVLARRLVMKQASQPLTGICGNIFTAVQVTTGMPHVAYLALPRLSTVCCAGASKRAGHSWGEQVRPARRHAARSTRGEPRHQQPALSCIASRHRVGRLAANPPLQG